MSEDALIIRTMMEPLALIVPLSTPAQVKQRDRVEEFWELAAHLFYRERCDAKHKVPTSRKLLRKFEPWGDFLIKKWYLCEGCHSRKGAETPYRDASEWFAAVIAETRRHDFYAPFRSDATKGKRDEIEKMRETVKSLLNYRNPYKPDPDQIHGYRLVEVALNISKQEPRFDLKYFIPCVKAYQRWIDILHSDKEIQAVFENGGNLYVRLGQGAGKRKIAG